MGDSIQLIVSHKVYGRKVVITRSATGEAVPEELDVMVKEVKLVKWFKKDGIVSVEETMQKDNRVSKTRSVIFDRYSGRFYETFHPVSSVMRSLYESTLNKSSIGFINNGCKVPQ